MPSRLLLALTIILALLSAPLTAAGPAKYVEPVKPAAARVSSASVGPPPATSGSVRVPFITWGGDAATLFANGGKKTAAKSLFGAAGLNLELTKQDDPVIQVQDYLSGKSPFLRGTMGMIATYSEKLNADPRTKPVVILQLTWSSGGDCLVVRDAIKSPRDLKGKTIALQAYGPHVEYMDQVLRDAGLSWSDVTIKWVDELFDLNGETDDPASVMRADKTVDAVFCISPDAAALTSGMTMGSGAESSVRGARVLLSTRTASRVISDVYVVRQDFFNANRDWVERFVRAHFKAQEEVIELLKKRESKPTADFIRMSADALLDNPEAVADTEGLLADCSFAQAVGNASYFVDAGNLTGFSPNVKRNMEWLVTQGYINKTQDLVSAEWDFSSFGVAGTATPAVRFNRDAAAKAAQAVDDSGILFEFEISFEPNQDKFEEARYGQQFQRALELASTYSGALLEIVGHADPRAYNSLLAKNPVQQTIDRQKQAGLVLSQKRAESVRASLLQFAGGKKIVVNETQFISTGRGYDDPKVAKPVTSEESASNRRVQFRIVNIEGESGDILE